MDIPQVYVMQVGDPRWSRYVIVDLDGRYWSRNGWTGIRGDADLFGNEEDALAARNRHCTEGEETETYTATVVVTVTKGQWTEDELRRYLRYRGKFYRQHASELKAIIVEVVPDDLKRVEEGNGD